MKKLFLVLVMWLFLCPQVFAWGNIFDRGATNAETTAQSRDDVWLRPSNIPYLPTGGGEGNVTGPSVNTDGYIPQWSGANSTALKNGLAVENALNANDNATLCTSYAIKTAVDAVNGSSIILDLGDDSGNDSIDLGEIATSGDTNNIFTEPSADKLLINVALNWPIADTANAGDNATDFFSVGEIIDARISNTLTSSIFIGSGSSTNAVDLATAEVAGTLPEANVHADLMRDAEWTAASTTAQGKVELATGAETVTGTDATRVVTPDGLTDKMAAPGAIGGTTPSTGAFTTITTGQGAYELYAMNQDVETSDNVTFNKVTSTEGFVSGAKAEPGNTYDVIGTVQETIDAHEYAIATDSGNGTEDIDWYRKILVNGVLTTRIHLDADGYNNFRGADMNIDTGKKYRINGTQIGLPNLASKPITGLTATNWRVFYSAGGAAPVELALGADGTYLRSNGAAAAPTFTTPSGAGDVTKVGTPSNYQWGIWTGDGTLKGLGVTASRAVVTDANGQPVAATTTATEIGYVNGLSSALQTQLDARCLESVFGISVSTGLVKDGTALKASTGLQSLSGLTLTAGDMAIATGANAWNVLNHGETTEVLVGGGAANPVWTTATGSGAPVRATSPTLTTPALGAATATSLVSTGNISGEIPITLDTAATVDLSVASNTRGHARINNDNDVIDYTLPPAEAGLSVCFYSRYAAVVTIDVDDGVDVIVLDGTALTAGYAIDSPGTAGDFICLMCIDATYWLTLGRSGTWVDGGAD